MTDNGSNKVIILGKENEASVFINSRWADYCTFGLLQLPQTLIKFFSNEPIVLDDKTCHNYSLEALQNNTVHLSHPSVFNDPFDGTLKIDFETYCDKMLKAFVEPKEANILQDCSAEKKIEYIHANIETDQSLEDFISMFHQWHQEEKNKLQNMGVCCFTGPELLTSNLMWAHYANSHKGFCIEYELPKHENYKDEDWISKLDPWQKSFLSNTFPMAYCEKKLDFSPKWLEMDSTIEKSDDYMAVFPYYQYGLITKGIDWSYECEWRFIHPLIKKGLENRHPLSCRLKSGNNFEFFPIKSLYLGCRMDKKVQKAVINTVGNRDIKIYKACPTDNYDFKFEEIK